MATSDQGGLKDAVIRSESIGRLAEAGQHAANHDEHIFADKQVGIGTDLTEIRSPLRYRSRASLPAYSLPGIRSTTTTRSHGISAKA